MGLDAFLVPKFYEVGEIRFNLRPLSLSFWYRDSMSDPGDLSPRERAKANVFR